MHFTSYWNIVFHMINNLSYNQLPKDRLIYNHLGLSVDFNPPKSVHLYNGEIQLENTAKTIGPSVCDMSILFEPRLLIYIGAVNNQLRVSWIVLALITLLTWLEQTCTLESQAKKREYPHKLWRNTGSYAGERCASHSDVRRLELIGSGVPEMALNTCSNDISKRGCWYRCRC